MSRDYQSAPEGDSDELFNQLCSRETSKHVYLRSEDPIGLYNHVVRQFNSKINRVSDDTFEQLETSCFYSFWMVRWWTRLRADESYSFLVCSLVINFFFGLLPILNLVFAVCWLIVYGLYERTVRPHKKNKELSADPFKWMVYAPEVCRRTQKINNYYEMPVRELSNFGIKESQQAMLQSRAIAGVATFMVYSKRFKAAYTKIYVLRCFHIAQLLVITTSILLANLLLYPEIGTDEFLEQV